MNKMTETFGMHVFNEAAMEQRLPKDIYKSLQRTRIGGKHFNLDVANVVANAMKEWAVELGATHFTHWFHPMTGITAEKHEAFLSPNSAGKPMLSFSGKALVSGEPDASSFPSGGIRATFEARGYTAWDPTSDAFIKDNTLCIPTAFLSYGGECLDKKTPLLRSLQALDKQAMRVLRLFGNTTSKRVIPAVGAEQEYFLIDREFYAERPDLINCNRTLLGAPSTKGQAMEDHYFGVIKPRVSAFMKDLDQELWKLGIYAHTKHNEVAPSQFELAPVFAVCNVAADQNQLTMEMMNTVAHRHGYHCLLHEKPYAGVNGSGKHNNFSLVTDDGINLQEPGDTPHENAQFLLFLLAFIKAVDEHQDLLRCAVASAGNDHRLGANEAPPAIISMFLGEELTRILEAIEIDAPYTDQARVLMEIGVTVLPHFPKDTTDRNRTSPFAFTGNKFEFRMLGSSFSISGPNFVLNTILAESLEYFADKLEGAADFLGTLHDLIQENITAHKRIIFNGNNYSSEWQNEAAARGLLNLKSTPEALPYFISEENIRLFEAHHVLSRKEMESRYEILMDNYCKILHIEALTMLDMVKKSIYPATIAYQNDLLKVAVAKQSLGSGLSTALEDRLLGEISGLTSSLIKEVDLLDQAIFNAEDVTDVTQKANFYHSSVFEEMQTLRIVVDELENVVGKTYWPFPSYDAMLFSVR